MITHGIATVAAARAEVAAERRQRQAIARRARAIAARRPAPVTRGERIRAAAGIWSPRPADHTDEPDSYGLPSGRRRYV